MRAVLSNLNGSARSAVCGEAVFGGVHEKAPTTGQSRLFEASVASPAASSRRD